MSLAAVPCGSPSTEGRDALQWDEVWPCSLVTSVRSREKFSLCPSGWTQNSRHPAAHESTVTTAMWKEHSSGPLSHQVPVLRRKVCRWGGWVENRNQYFQKVCYILSGSGWYLNWVTWLTIGDGTAEMTGTEWDEEAEQMKNTPDAGLCMCVWGNMSIFRSSDLSGSVRRS